MNAVFQKFLRRFLLVFFDDILVYTKNVEEHVDHLKQVLLTLRSNCFFAKWSECYFAISKVEYLGHFISGSGVTTDPSKIEVILNWPLPQTIKYLRMVSWSCWIYRRFVKGYGVVAKPLTDMLKENGFTWTKDAKLAF